jgi:hypothetical protein
MVVREDDLEFESIYCIHTLDDILSYMLKSLRECQAADPTRVNKTFIRFNHINSGKRISVTGAAIKEFIASAWGGNGVKYSQIKTAQISNLGFTGHPYLGSFTLVTDSDREVADVMLGIKKGKIKDFQVTETRWGISIPHHRSAEAEVLITPQPKSTEAVLRSKSLGESVSLKMSVVASAFPPPLSKGYAKILVFNDFLEFIIERDGDTCSFGVQPKEQPFLPLSSHIALNKTLRILNSGEGSMTLKTGGRRIDFGEFDNGVHNESADHFSFSRQILEQIKGIVDRAGGDDVCFSTTHVNSQIGAINFVHDLMTAPVNSSAASANIIPTPEFPEDLLETEALITGYIELHDAAIAFCAIGVANISGNAALKTIQVAQMRLREVRMIDSEPSASEEFQKDMEAETGLSLSLRLGATGIRVTNDLSP